MMTGVLSCQGSPPPPQTRGHLPQKEWGRKARKAATGERRTLALPGFKFCLGASASPGQALQRVGRQQHYARGQSVLLPDQSHGIHQRFSTHSALQETPQLFTSLGSALNHYLPPSPLQISRAPGQLLDVLCTRHAGQAGQKPPSVLAWLLA